LANDLIAVPADWARRAKIDAAGYGRDHARSLAAPDACWREQAAHLDWIRTPTRTDAIQFAPGLPRTRSGKIMRRILRKIAEGDTRSRGDTSTLADPSVIGEMIANRHG
jgi:acetyl-CoA synthetase